MTVLHLVLHVLVKLHLKKEFVSIKDHQNPFFYIFLEIFGYSPEYIKITESLNKLRSVRMITTLQTLNLCPLY